MSESVRSTAPSEASEKAQRHTILVVDDEESLRSIVCRTLRDEGFGILEAAHGAEALEVIEKAGRPVDLVVTDVVMPGMDGRELGRRLTQRWPALPILYISAYDVNDIFRRGSPRSSAPFLQKPFPPQGLISRVKQLLASHSSR
jgi:CheY-like chemotaxis protein